MNPQQFDLLPQTLLVSIEGGQVFTTSLKVAEFAKKQHKDVLRAIGAKLKVLSAGFNERNFALIDYVDSRGRSKPMCKMTEEGFALTMMGFTGKEAVQWQEAFIEDFIAKRQSLHNRVARFARVLDEVRPSLRLVVEATERGLNRTAIAAPLGKTPGAITYHRSQARRFGLL